MRVLLFALALVALVAGASATRVFRGPLASNEAASGYSVLSRADGAQRKPLRFAVKQRNLDQLDQLVDRVSNPQSESYAQYMTAEEVAEIFGNPEAAQAVVDFVVASGIHENNVKVSKDNCWVEVDASVEEAERLLAGARFMNVQVGDDKRVIATPSFSLPSEVADLIDLVTGTTQVPVGIQKFVSFETRNGLNIKTPGDAFPSVVNGYYNVPAPTSAARKGSLSLFEAIGQDYSPADLKTFEKNYGVEEQAIAKVIGPNTPLACLLNPNSCGEASLDVQYAISTASKVEAVYWSIPAADQTPFLTWVAAVSASSDPPLVHSISYGGDEKAYGATNALRFDAEVAKLGLRGVTVLVASGDDGVAGAAARSDPLKCGLSPSFPASAPHVLSVGATQGPEASPPTTEIACTSPTGGLITTGSGFSTVYPQPSYQTAAVQHFLSTSKTLPPSTMYNATNRAYPDVALLGHSYEITVNSEVLVGSGTSASTPVMAGMIALVNAELLENGKNPVGFVNPALYQLDSGVWNDISSGENNCCAGPVGRAVCCTYGFTAGEGFDLVGGLGSVKDFSVFAKALIALQ